MTQTEDDRAIEHVTSFEPESRGPNSVAASLAERLERRERGGPTILLESLTYGVDYLDAVIVFSLADGSMLATWQNSRTVFSSDGDAFAQKFARSLRSAYLAATEANAEAERAVGGDSDGSGSEPLVITLESTRHATFVHSTRSLATAFLFQREAPLGLIRAHAARMMKTLEPELPDWPAPPTPRRQTDRPIAASTSQSNDRLRAVAARPRPESKDATESDGPRTVLSDTGNARPEHASGSSDDEAPPSEVAVETPVQVVRERHDDAPDTPRAPVDLTEPSPGAAARAAKIIQFLEAGSIEPQILLLRLALRCALGIESLRKPELLSAEDVLVLEGAAEEILGLEAGGLTGRMAARTDENVWSPQ